MIREREREREVVDEKRGGGWRDIWGKEVTGSGCVIKVNW